MGIFICHKSHYILDFVKYLVGIELIFQSSLRDKEKEGDHRGSPLPD